MKPENILLESKNSNRIKIIDLGLSQIINKEISLNVERGSIYYLAPEMIKKKYNHKVDIWSTGVIFYILITGKPPFNAMVRGKNGNMGLDSKMIKEKILVGKVDFSDVAFADVNPGIIEIIKMMMTLNPDERPEAKEILKHPWFRSSVDNNQRQKGITMF